MVLPDALRSTGFALRRPRAALGALVALVVACTVLVGEGTDVAEGLLIDDVRADANWILSAQFSDGAIANYVDKQAVWPYLANFAASGLARATEMTGDRRYTDAAWRWLSWYQSKMDATGFVTDYVLKDGALVSNGFMDSTDSYAATFLLAIRDTHRATKDLNRVKNLRAGIAKAVGAIEATQEPDGLTWAKPDWKVKYLMDQAETYAGLRAASDLANLLKDPALARRATNDAVRMKTGVDALWNPTVEAYDWAVHENGARVANNWSFLYSDALQQPWAVSFGLVEPVRAQALLARFNLEQPLWAVPAATSLFSGGSSQTVGYWPEAGRAFAQLNSPVAPLAVTSIRTGALASNRAWPFTTGNAGQLIMFAAYAPTLSLLPLPGILSQPLATSTSTTTTTRRTTTTTAFAPVVLAASTPAPTSTSTSAPTTAPTTTTTKPPGPINLSLDLGPVSVRLGGSGTPG